MSIRKPGGATRDRTADLLHAMQALSQLSYNPLDSRLFEENLVELRGIEPRTSCMPCKALSQLSYNPNSPRRYQSYLWQRRRMIGITRFAVNPKFSPAGAFSQNSGS